jgi:hypothetical protein
MRMTFAPRRIEPGPFLAPALTVILLLAVIVAPAAAQPAPRAQAVDGGNVTIVEHAGGRFLRIQPRMWVELSATGARLDFAEDARDAGSVTLGSRDGRRTLILDLRAQQILIAEGDRPPRPLYAITRTAAGPAALPTTQQACAEAFQSRVAWNRQGNTRWRPDLLERLCATTTQVASTVECVTGEIRSHDNLQRAIQACTEHRHQVQVVYVLPRDVEPLPNAEAAIAAMMATVQQHYFRELGRTFQLRTPLVTVVRHDQTAQALTAAMALNRGRVTGDLIASRFRADFEYRENVILFVVEGVSLPTATGGGNVVVIPMNFWRSIHQHFMRSPGDLHRAGLLHGWSHELGHAFGLSHTEEGTRPCFARFGVAMGPFPSLIMQKTTDRPSLFDYPFMPDEKRLLLEETYYPICRSLLGNRPHASRHLRHPLPAALAVPPAPPAVPAVTGLDVRRVGFRTGAFHMTEPGQWVEEDASGRARFAFVEQHRDARRVTLADAPRGIRIQLDVAARRVEVSQNGGAFALLVEMTEVSR